ncbi:MAG: hypothetical protein A2Y76_01225 [Planctomycetes bacterium RBG_13_60_9]|nr:MAG: hypothetical protein A2Y76_01225 [Planctomycetes bacterium RBG_13_60_9]
MEHVLSETELLRQSVAGDREAFGALVERYQSLVYAIAYSATGSMERSEELSQETFLRAWGNLRQIRDLARFRAWLCTITRNLASRAGKDKSRDVLAAAASLEGAAIAARELGPDETLISRERQEIVWSALRRIPGKYREPMVLFYSAGRSVREVAAELELSEHAVRQRLYRGRQLLNAGVSSLVEDTLARVRPGRAFSAVVVALLPAVTTPTAGAVIVGAKGVPAAKALWAGVVGGALLGPVLGLLGGVLGAWCSIRNTKSPRERRFAIRMAVFVWLLLLALGGLPLTLALAGLVPKWACWSCFAAFFALLLPLILWGNAHQRRIQIQDGTYRPPEPSPARITRSGLHASFGGGIFGGTLWLLILAWLVKDWVSFSAILACDILVFLAATEICVRNPQRYWSVAVLMVCALMAVTLTAVNLRWTAWMDAYRQSAAYNPANDVSLLTMNLVILGAFVALLAVFAIRHVRHKAARGNQASSSRE